MSEPNNRTKVTLTFNVEKAVDDEECDIEGHYIKKGSKIYVSEKAGSLLVFCEPCMRRLIK